MLDLEHRAKGVLDKPSETDKGSSEALRTAQDDTKAALSDSFNTSITMAAISTLITSYNNIQDPAYTDSIRDTALWISSMVNMLGLNGTAPYPANTIGWSGVSIPEEARSAVYEVSALRDTLRDLAISKDDSAAPKLRELITTQTTTTPAATITAPLSNPYTQALHTFRTSLSDLPLDSPTLKPSVLSLCDYLRDTTLWSLSIYIEDRPAPLPSLPRPITPQLRAARHDREFRAATDAARKLEREKQKSEEQAKADEKAKVDPRVMFKVGERAGEFAEWDDKGLPLRLKDGSEVGKSRGKKLVKEWEVQRKRWEAWQGRMMQLQEEEQEKGKGEGKGEGAK